MITIQIVMTFKIKIYVALEKETNDECFVDQSVVRLYDKTIFTEVGERYKGDTMKWTIVISDF
jgi:hypothetical protein